LQCLVFAKPEAFASGKDGPGYHLSSPNGSQMSFSKLEARIVEIIGVIIGPFARVTGMSR
jgi:hypothetical protein